MNAVLTQSKNNSQWLGWAILVSMCLHIAIMVFVPKWQLTQKKPSPAPIEVELMQAAAPSQPEPTPPTPEPKVLPKPSELPKPKPSVLPQPTQPPKPVTEPNPTPVIAVAPTKSEVKPELVVPPPPPPEPPKVTGPSEGDIEGARNAFRSAAHRELKRGQRYPKIAIERGVEGEVKLEISLDKEGNVTNVSVVESSGSSALDEAAINAAKRANLKQHIQDILKGKIDSVTVTVSFKLG